MKIERINGTTIVFQTNCLYAENGQVIAARKMDDGSIIINDISRGVYGRIENCQLNAYEINRRYLNNEVSLDVDYEVTRELADIAIENQDLVPRTR